MWINIRSFIWDFVPNLYAVQMSQREKYKQNKLNLKKNNKKEKEYFQKNSKPPTLVQENTLKTKQSFTIQAHKYTMQAFVTIETGHSGHIEDLLKKPPWQCNSLYTLIAESQAVSTLQDQETHQSTASNKLREIIFSILAAFPFGFHISYDANDQL